MKSAFLPSQLYELEKVLLPYKKSWKHWTGGKDCPLNKGEVKAVESYLKSRSYTISAKELGSSELILFIKIKNVITRLNLLNRLNGF